MSKTTVVPASSGLQVDTRISRKELVDMILDEQEATLEDAIEKSYGTYVASQDTHKKVKSSVSDDIGTILEAKQDKKIIVGLKKLFPKKKISMIIDIEARERVYKHQCGDKTIELYLSADVSILLKDKESRGNYIHIKSYNKVDLLKIKEVKALVKLLSNARINEEQARTINVEAIDNLKKFKKKGKRARTEFTRELMKNSPEGQAMLTQLDTIKKNTRKLLK